MKRNHFIISAVVILAVVLLAILLRFLIFYPSDRLTQEALSSRCVYITDNIDITSTAGRRQTKTIRALLASTGTSGGLGDVTVEYPFNEAMFPPEFIPPMFIWKDSVEETDTWLVDVSLPDNGGHIYILAPKNPLPAPEIDMECYNLVDKDHPALPPYQPPETNWTPSDDLWEKIKERTVDRYADISIYGFDREKPDRVLTKGTVRLCTSKDSVGAPVFYRDVPMIGLKRKLEDELAGVIQPLPTKAQDLIKWRLRDVSKPESRVVLADMPTCANCHSFSADGSTMGMDIDGPAGDKGAYAIAKIASDMVIEKEDIISWNYSYREKFKGQTKTIGFLSQISPDGRYAITTLNEQVFVSNYRNHDFIQVFYPTRGYLGYYSAEADDIRLLPGADDPKYVHCDAVWSPDGDYLVFARATARESNIEGRPRPLYANDPNETPIQYDLYRIPFNEGRGGKPVPIDGARDNGMSNTFPKISPDNKWIVFVKCMNGQLMRPDSRLWIVPAKGGEAREMRCNLPLMNSWHTFSPNGRWLAFSSKGMSPYTRLFLTHIDENGNDTPPVLVPNCTAPNRAVNIPEFVNISYDDLVQIDVPAVEYYRHHKKALALGDQGKFKEALEELRLALSEEPDDIKVKWELHHRTGLALQQFGDIDGAIEQWQMAIDIDPEVSSEPYFMIALAYANSGRLAEARSYFEKAVEYSPKHTRAIYYLAKLSLEKNDPDLYNPRKAIQYAKQANDLTQNREPIMLEMLAWAYASDGRIDEALKTMERALEYAKPRGVEDHINRIEEKIALYKEGKTD